MSQTLRYKDRHLNINVQTVWGWAEKLYLMKSYTFKIVYEYLLGMESCLPDLRTFTTLL